MSHWILAEYWITGDSTQSYMNCSFDILTDFYIDFRFSKEKKKQMTFST